MPKLIPEKKPFKKAKSAAGPEIDWPAFYQRYVLIYPSETAWDSQFERVVKLSAMRAAFGKGAIEQWLGSAERRTINERDLVFDPTCSCDPKSTVNIFTGLVAKPSKKGSCDKLVELLLFLVNGDEALFDWVIRWIAYPLQHVGAKMRSAVVMHGAEGAGKNLFWDSVRRIYGQHGGIITQQQVQSQFNGWASGKLFMIANEVVTRQDLRHHVGLLKNLITEPEIWINEKMLPERVEANHLNLVFLSNELQPLQLGRDDRRYGVIKTPQKAAKAMYEAVGRELDAGGVARFYQFLLDTDCTGFSEFSEPIYTAAKDELIELGMSSTQLFWDAWHDGQLGLPYCTCASEDLYQCYEVYCKRTGERVPARSHHFASGLMGMNGLRRLRKRIVPEGLDLDRDPRQRTVFIIGEPGDKPESTWLRENVRAFNIAARTYLDRHLL